MRASLPYFLLLALSSGLSAGEFRAGESVRVVTPVSEDLYAAGGTVNVSAATGGDLVAVGGNVLLASSVAGDVLAGGGTIDVKGRIADDVRIVGGTISISGDVGGDAVLAGGTLLVFSPTIRGDLVAAGGSFTATTAVSGKTLIAGGKVILGGRYARDVEIRADSVQINGRIGGNARISAKEIQVGPGASFAGTVRYWSENQPQFPGGRAIRDETLRYEAGELRGESLLPRFLVAGFFGFLLSLLAGAVSIAALQLLFPRFGEQSAARLAANLAGMLGRGALFVLASPMGVLLGLVTVVAIPLALLWMSAYAFLIVFAKVVAATAVSAWVLSRKYIPATGWKLYGATLIVFTLIKLIGLVPVLGFLAGLAWVVLAAGLVIDALLELRREGM